MAEVWLCQHAVCSIRPAACMSRPLDMRPLPAAIGPALSAASSAKLLARQLHQKRHILQPCSISAAEDAWAPPQPAQPAEQGALLPSDRQCQQGLLPQVVCCQLVQAWRRVQRALHRGRGGPLMAASGAMVTNAWHSPNWQGGGFADLGTNYVFMAGFWAWFLAQGCKIFTRRWRKGIWDLRAIVDSGGMPSSHSALCSAVTTTIAVEFGMASALFAMSLAFSLIVMYDAAGVRRHAGKQAEVLNILLEDLLEGHAVSETKLKEVLGHTPIQVCAGALLGVLVGWFFPTPPMAPLL